MIASPATTAPPLTTLNGGDNAAACAFGHRTHCGTCAGCQRAVARRHAAELNDATEAHVRWAARTESRRNEKLLRCQVGRSLRRAETPSLSVQT
jgi:hypothetical protein